MILGKQYKNLPGMLIDFKDGGKALKFNDNTGNTDSILLLGTAIDGPVMEPVAVDDQSVESLFGSDSKAGGVPNGSTLVSAYKHMRDAGAEDIRLMRISGGVASAQIGAKDEESALNKRVEENLGVINGNDETRLSLGNTHDEKKNIKVFAKGIALEETNHYTYESSNNIDIVTIKKGVANAGASVMVRFNYDKVETGVKETHTLIASESKDICEIKLNNRMKNLCVVKITVGGKDVVIGEAVGNAKVDYSSGKITFINVVTPSQPPQTKAAAFEEGQEATVIYDAIVVGSEQITSTPQPKGRKAKTADNVIVDGDFILRHTEQELPLKEVPKDKKAVLYVDGAKVLNPDSFEIKIPEGADSAKVVVDNRYFEKGSLIAVSYEVSKPIIIKRKINLESYFGGMTYNLGLVEVKDIKVSGNNDAVGKVVIITKPESKRSAGELPQSYSSLDYPTFGDLVDAINANNGVYKATTDTLEVATSELECLGTYFAEGEDGVNISKQAIFEALSGIKNSKGEYLELGAYHLLENYKVDTVIPLGVYADDELMDKFDNFAYELALFCAATSQRSNTVYGNIAMKPLKNVSLAGIQEYAEYLTKFDNTYLMKDLKGSVILTGDGTPIDLGKFISVVVGPAPIMRHPIPSLREANPACVYAALSATLLPQSATTNKGLKGVTGIKYVFSDAQLDAITGNRLVTFTNKYSGSGRNVQSCVAVDGVTAAREGSEYSRLTTMKIMRDVANNTREVAEPFIGEPNTIEQRNALSALLSKRYDILIELGELISYDMNLISSAADTALGQARLELAIHAPEELRKITTVMGLKR